MGQKASKVDYRLLDRRQIKEFLESLRDKQHTIWQMERSMKKLFALGEQEQVIPVCISKLKENDEALAPIICYALEYANNYDVIDSLSDILLMPNISDKIKARVLTVMAHYGVDVGELPLNIIIKDFKQIAKESLEELLNDINEDYFLIPYVLDDLEEFTTEMKIAYIRDIGSLKNEKALPLLEILVLTDEIPVAQEAAKALGKMKSGKALFVLTKLANFVEKQPIKETVLREARRLKFSGIAIEGYAPPAKLDEPVKMILSAVDGLGNRALWIAWENPNSKLSFVTMNLLLNAITGVRDCWCISQIASRDFDLSIKELSKTTIIMESNLEYILDLIRDALYWNKKTESPLPYQFYFWKYLLSQKYNLKPKIYTPALQYIEDTNVDDEALRETFELYNYNIFQDWFISDPRVYDFADRNKSKRGYTLKKMTYKKAENLFENFTKELIEPNIVLIKRMLELTADFVIKMGQGEIAENIMTAFAYMDSKPLYYHPFVQRMVLESLKVAFNNMKNGFDMRLNPEVFE